MALHELDANWRAVNYLSVGQIYLLDNPLLRELLEIKHTKPRLLGHWGSPGLNFVYAHLNRVIREPEISAFPQPIGGFIRWMTAPVRG